MTMHVILGDGELPAEELEALLADMSVKANKADDPFWFLIQGKAEPTPTDEFLARWLIEHDVYYDVISDGSESELYEKYQNKYTVKRLAPKVVSLMAETPDPGEEARLLALFASDDPDSEQDRWLNDVIQAVNDAGYKVIAMNDGMQEIKLVNTNKTAEAEPEAEVIPLKSAAATKKAAAQPELKDEPVSGNGAYTREELEEMNLDGLKEVAAKRGIELPPRTRMPTYIDAILGNTKNEEVEEVEIPEVEAQKPTMPYVSPTMTPANPAMSTGTTSTTSTISIGAIQAPAMLIVVHNGSVVSRAITAAEAQELMLR